MKKKLLFIILTSTLSWMNDIKKIVAYYKRKTGTSDPFTLADRLGILYQFCDLNFDGCYMFLKNHRYIFINQNL